MKMINLFILISIVSCNISAPQPVDNQQPVYFIDNQDYSEYSKAYFIPTPESAKAGLSKSNVVNRITIFFILILVALIF